MIQSDRLIYSVWGGAEPTLNVGYSAGGKAGLDLSLLLGSGRHLAREWNVAPYYLARDGRATRTWKVPDASLDTASIKVRADRAAELREGLDDLVESLPISVEGVPWTLIHYVGSIAHLDEARSDWSAPPLPHPYQRYSMIRRAVLRDEPRLYIAFFTIEGTGGSWLHCGAAFRERVMRMGLVGLSFKEAGYFHREGDPEPPPPEPWPPAARAIELPPSKWSPSAPSVEVMRSISPAAEAMRSSLRIAADASAEDVLAALTKHLVALRPIYAKLDDQERQNQLLGLAAVFGSLFVQRLDWNWRQLTAGDERLLAVATADDSHFIAVSAYVDTLLRHKQRDITLTLQFNMAHTKLLPHSAPGALVELR